VTWKRQREVGGEGGEEFQILGVEVPAFWTINLIPSKASSLKLHPSPPPQVSKLKK